MSDLSDKIDALIQQVAAENDVITGAETLLKTLNDELQAAISNPGNDPALVQKIQNVIDTVTAKQSELAAAVAANTPAAPAPSPAPEPPPTT